MIQKKDKILVLTSTFPRWKNDTNPPFVFELSKRLNKKFEIIVSTPHFPKSKTFEKIDGLKIFRYRYFLSVFEKLAGNGGILPTLKKNKFYYLVVPFFLIGQLFSTIKLVYKTKPKIIHAHWIVPQGIIAFLVFKMFKIPYIITSHGSDLHSLGMIRLKKIILENAKKITVVSSFLAEEIKKIDRSLIEKTEIIPMGVDTKIFNPKKYDLSIKTKYEIDGKFLLFVGRLAPEKGIDYLIEAMPKVIEKYKNIKLLIIGNGVLEKELKEKVEILKIEKNIEFLGAIKHDDLPPYFATADIFVSPSLKEGTPTTYLEALASGLFLIAGNLPISKELINNENGRLVRPNKNEISSAIIDVLEKIKNNKTVCFDKKYKWENVVKKFENIL